MDRPRLGRDWRELPVNQCVNPRKGRLARFGLTAFCAAMAGAVLPSCELFVGTDDFVTSPDASGTTTSMSGSTSTSGGTSSSASTSTGGGSSDDGSTTEGGLEDASFDKDGAPFDDARPTDSGKGESVDAGDAAVEGGTGVCASQSNDPTCVACWKEACCSQYAACQASTDCLNIATCIENCSASPCDCTGTSQGLQLYAAMATCGALANTTDCSICEASGTGDQCNSENNCVGSLVCLYDGYQAAASNGNCTPTTCGGWCSPNPCSFNSDCAGNFGTAGLTETGQANACILYDGFGDTMCFPLCGPGNSCASVPLTTCQADVDVEGNSVMACE